MSIDYSVSESKFAEVLKLVEETRESADDESSVEACENLIKTLNLWIERTREHVVETSDAPISGRNLRSSGRALTDESTVKGKAKMKENQPADSQVEIVASYQTPQNISRPTRKRASTVSDQSESVSSVKKRQNQSKQIKTPPNQETKIKPTSEVGKSNKKLVKINDDLDITISEITNLSNTSFSSQVSSVNITKRNRKGETSLHSACSLNKLELVKSLLAQGLHPNTKDNAGWTPLHEAVGKKNIEMVKLLLEHGALPTVPGLDNITPLHEAVRNKSTVIIDLLLKYGADIHIRSSKGDSPLDISPEDLKPRLISQYTEKDAEKAFPSILAMINKQPSTLRIYPLLKDKNNRNKLQRVVTAHKNLIVHKQINSDTDVLITDDFSINANILKCVLIGILIVKSEWLDGCGASLPVIGDYLVPDLKSHHPCVRLSHINRKKLFPRLFDGCHFFFYGFTGDYKVSDTLTVNREILGKFVECGGGNLLKRTPDPEAIPAAEETVPFHADADGNLSKCSHYIIYDKKPKLAYNMKHIKALPVEWFIESIKNFKLIDPEHFLD